MNKNISIDSVLDKDLVQKLESLEPKRVKVNLIMKWIGRISLSLFIISLFIYFKDGGTDLFQILLIGCVVVGVGGAVIYNLYTAKHLPYIDKYKEYVVPKIISLIADDLSYRPMQHINESRVASSRIIAGNSNFKVNGSDLINGNYHGIPIMLSYLRARSTGEESSTLFDGIFLVADFKKDFKGSVILLPNITRKNKPGFLSRMMSKGRSESYIQLEDTEFAKEYICYASDDILARYILSFSFKDKLLEYRKRYPHFFVIFSFIDGVMHLVVDNKRNPFTPSLQKPLTDKNQMKSLFDELMMVFEVVEVLELNEKIWSKE